jgi:hypothetical protein
MAETNSAMPLRVEGRLLLSDNAADLNLGEVHIWPRKSAVLAVYNGYSSDRQWKFLSTILNCKNYNLYVVL